MSNTNTHSGKIKFFNQSKGFGFIIDHLDNKEYFVHATAFKSADVPQENDEVDFDLIEGKKGLQCSNVQFTS